MKCFKDCKWLIDRSEDHRPDFYCNLFNYLCGDAVITGRRCPACVQFGEMVVKSAENTFQALITEFAKAHNIARIILHPSYYGWNFLAESAEGSIYEKIDCKSLCESIREIIKAYKNEAERKAKDG